MYLRNNYATVTCRSLVKESQNGQVFSSNLRVIQQQFPSRSEVEKKKEKTKKMRSCKIIHFQPAWNSTSFRKLEYHLNHNFKIDLKISSFDQLLVFELRNFLKIGENEFLVKS